VDGECAGNPGGAKFPIDDWIALVYNRCRSRAALATISLVKYEDRLSPKATGP